jgi:GMP synthase-like glutamine amidotransferase
MANRLRIRCLMHVPFEGPGIIADWSRQHHHRMEYTRFYEGDALPKQSEVDMLVIMGGPMDAIHPEALPWMVEEMQWISDFLGQGKPVLGICLGAQMIASSLGAKIFPGEHKEIGWHNLQFLSALGEFRIFPELPATRKVFHWHGDTFTIPDGATRIASSGAFPNQGFIYDHRVMALQFHLEVTPPGVKELVENCREDLVPAPYIQREKEILAEDSAYSNNQALMFRLLDYLSSQFTV